MKLNRPSPAMAVALLALVMSMTGGALAAVNYARNSGKVDGYDAVKAASSNRKAAGKLVATDEFGRFPAKFLSGVARTQRGSQTVAVEDNTTTAPATLIHLGLGDLLVACVDDQPAAGIENPATRIGITNYTGETLSIGRRAGSGQGAVNTFAPGTSDVFEVGGQGMFDAQVQSAGQTIFIHGGVRQTGQGTSDGSCVAFATAFFTDQPG